MVDVWHDLEQRRSELARHAANAAGQAATFVRFHTAGQGAIEFEDAIDFEVAFTEEPWISYGSFCDADKLRNLLDYEDDETPPLPQSSGFVTEWDRSDKGLYVGCWVAVRVSFPNDLPVPLDVPVSIDHYFKFEAIALKSIVT